MGQRHQIFIHTVNPYHAIKDYNYIEKGVKAKLKEMFGTKKTTVFAFHNQWLYGRSALVSALNVLEFNDGYTKEIRLDQTSYDANYKSPFHYKGMSNMVYNGLDQFKTVFLSVLNLDREGKYREKGWLGSWLLNEKEPEMRHFFDSGDNNDGITIIDAVTNKYCFMNINDYYLGDKEIYYSAIDLEPYKPCTAKEYVETYYPSVTAKARVQYYEGKEVIKGDPKFKQHVSETKKANNDLVKRFKNFELLTEEEIKKIFPKVYERLVK